MQETSELYQRLLRTRGHRKEIALEVAGDIYVEDRIVTLNTYSRLFRNNQMEVGCAVAKELRCTLRHPGNIPKAAQLIPKFRLRHGDEASEWVQKGIYGIYTREPNDDGKTITIVAFDAMVRADKVWQPRQTLEFPMSMRAAALEIASLIGVELDNPEAISDIYTIDYPANNWTQRNILQFIAAANAGNFAMTDLGRLRLYRLNDLPNPTHYLVDNYGSAITFGGVRILV